LSPPALMSRRGVDAGQVATMRRRAPTAPWPAQPLFRRSIGVGTHTDPTIRTYGRHCAATVDPQKPEPGVSAPAQQHVSHDGPSVTGRAELSSNVGSRGSEDVDRGQPDFGGLESARLLTIQPKGRDRT
jgi:hypothetical protein